MEGQSLDEELLDSQVDIDEEFGLEEILEVVNGELGDQVEVLNAQGVSSPHFVD